MKLKDIAKAFKNGSSSLNPKPTRYFHNLYKQCVNILEDLSEEKIRYLIKYLEDAGNEPITFYAFLGTVQLDSPTSEEALENMNNDPSVARKAFERKEKESICIKVDLKNDKVNFISTRAFDLNVIHAIFGEKYELNQGGGFIVETKYLTS